MPGSARRARARAAAQRATAASRRTRVLAGGILGKEGHAPLEPGFPGEQKGQALHGFEAGSGGRAGRQRAAQPGGGDGRAVGALGAARGHADGGLCPWRAAVHAVPLRREGGVATGHFSTAGGGGGRRRLRQPSRLLARPDKRAAAACIGASAASRAAAALASSASASAVQTCLKVVVMRGERERCKAPAPPAGAAGR